MSAQLYSHWYCHIIMALNCHQRCLEAGNAAIQPTSLNLQVPDKSVMHSQMFFYDTEVCFCAYKSFSNDFERQRFLE